MNERKIQNQLMRGMILHISNKVPILGWADENAQRKSVAKLKILSSYEFGKYRWNSSVR